MTIQAPPRPSARPEDPHTSLPAAQIAAWIRDARERNIALIADLSESQLLGQRMSYVQPPKWEAAHAAWFMENRVLERALGEPPFLPNGITLYDSTTIPHRVRWELPLPDYFKAIWPAMALGLVLAAGIEAALPHNWLARILGSATFRSTALGGVLALPGMM